MKNWQFWTLFALIFVFFLIITIKLYDISSKVMRIEKTDGVIRTMYEHTYNIQNDIKDIKFFEESIANNTFQANLN